MFVLVAIILLPLGLYDSLIKAQPQSKNGAKNGARLDVELVEMVARSERRIKRNIEKLLTLSNGLGLYSFQYKNDPNTYVGLMADELAKSKTFKPFVIHMGEGSYAINYEKLGIHPITYETFEKEGLAALQNAHRAQKQKTH